MQELALKEEGNGGYFEPINRVDTRKSTNASVLAKVLVQSDFKKRNQSFN